MNEKDWKQIKDYFSEQVKGLCHEYNHLEKEVGELAAKVDKGIPGDYIIRPCQKCGHDTIQRKVQLPDLPTWTTSYDSWGRIMTAFGVPEPYYECLTCGTKWVMKKLKEVDEEWKPEEAGK